MRLSKETKYKLDGAIWRLVEAAKDIEAKFPFKAQCLRSIVQTIDLAYGPGVKEEFFLSLPAGHYSVNLKPFELSPKDRLYIEGEPLEPEESFSPATTK
jgi:hypothetical protein